MPQTSSVTREIESRLKQTPEHLFELFLEIREPVDQEAPEIIYKYPLDYSDDLLKTAPTFAYPCKIPSDEQSEYFTFVILDNAGALFRFGFCRRSNRDATCLCIISFYPWFEVFYNILNDLSNFLYTKSTTEMEQYLSILYNYQLMSNEEFFEKGGKELIEVTGLSKGYSYSRPDPRKLPAMLSSRNFTVMSSRLGPEILLHLFSHVLFERRILFVSSKLFHLTACVYGCSHLIYPMHWQSIFLPIIPSSMIWTTQCTAPYIIGVHTSQFASLNRSELGDVVIVNIDERRLESEHDDLSSFPKYLIRSLKKGIQQTSQLAGDHLARVFLRTMAFALGNYADGFTLRNEQLDFDRDLYLEQYLGTNFHTFMVAVANTQMFEQFSRYRTYLQFQRETDIDEFDIEVKHLKKIQQSKKYKTNKKIYKIIEKAANPLLEQVQNKAGKLQTAMNKAGQRVASEASSMRNNFTSIDISDMIKRGNPIKGSQSIDDRRKTRNKSTDPSNRIGATNENHHQTSTPQLINSDRISSSSSDSSRSTSPELERSNDVPLINIDSDENSLLPSPIVLNVVQSPSSTPTIRPVVQIDSTIKHLQNELQRKVQTFDGKRINPRDEYSQQTEITRLVKQFDPLNDPNYFKPITNSPIIIPKTVLFRPEVNSTSSFDRHPSIQEKIPNNCVNKILQTFQDQYGTTSRLTPVRTTSQRFSPASTAPAALFSSIQSEDSPYSFDPFEPSTNDRIDFSPSRKKRSESNLIDLD